MSKRWSPRRLALVAAAVMLAAGPGRGHLPIVAPALARAAGRTAPQASQPQQPPVFHTGVELVTADVTVLDRGGSPLTTLQAEDFTVLVDGSPRRIVSLRLVGAETGTAGAAAPASPAGRAPAVAPAAAPGRLFALVVDRDHIPAGEGQQMLDAGGRFLGGLAPADRAAIWTIPPSASGFRFSNDREALKRELRLAVGTYRPPMVSGVAGRGQFNIARDEAVQIDEGRRDVLSAVIARECPPPPANLPDTCPDDVPIAARTIADDWRQRAQVTLTGLLNLIEALGTVDGPKHLVLITGGPLNTAGELSLINMVAAQASTARVTIHALQVAEAPYQARTDQMRASPAQVDQGLSAAYFLAGLTGGLATTPVSGDIGFGQLARELSASYLLAFEAIPSDRDGKSHKIEVRVRDRGWGSLVRARRTFRIEPGGAQPAETAPPAPGPMPAPAPAPAPATPEPAPAPTPPPGGEALGTEIGGLTQRLAAYVQQFEREVSAVVAEERYVQLVHPWRGNPKGPESEPGLEWQEPGSAPKKGGPIIARRQILSDILLVQLQDQQWIGFRDVAVVDGNPVRGRQERLRDLFLSKAPTRDAQLRGIAEESARYNLGNFRRNLNIPTVTLSFMRGSDQWRYRFKRLGDETVDGRTCRVLGYTEHARPTLIGTPGGNDIPIEGRIWMDAEDGRVVRTELRFDRGGERRCFIRVEYRAEASLSVLVPARMWEWYEGGDQLGRIGGDKTLVHCIATYSNLRRFQVSTTEQVK